MSTICISLFLILFSALTEIMRQGSKRCFYLFNVVNSELSQQNHGFPCKLRNVVLFFYLGEISALKPLGKIVSRNVYVVTYHVDVAKQVGCKL
jgi:hypothetical protein